MSNTNNNDSLPKLSENEKNKFIYILWISFISVALFITSFIYAVSSDVFGPLPTFKELERAENALSSDIITSDGKTIGSFYLENRKFTKYKDLSPHLLHALISTEDSRFEEHSGIDFFRLVTIIYYNLTGRKQGGSTITQQLAKQLFGRDNSSIFIIKVKEIITAIRLERNYSKEEIITMYFNTVDFGNNSFGIHTAAKTYFNTTPKELSMEQAALLVGMLKAPSYYSPIRNPERAKNRRNTVLYRMLAEKFISEDEFATAKELPLGLNFKVLTHNDGIAPYFREYIREQLSILTKSSKFPKKEDGTNYDIYRDGLKIHVTIDSKMQQYAEEAEFENLFELNKQWVNHWKELKKDPLFELSEESLWLAVRRTDRYKLLNSARKTTEEIKENFNTKTKMTVFSWYNKKNEVDTIMTPMDSIKYYKRILRSAMVAIDPHTGYIKAWVGGLNYKYFKYDQVGHGARQLGSTFKPFVYTEAIENGFHPCDSILDEPVNFEVYEEDGSKTIYSPKNAEGSYGGKYTIADALAQSKNLVTMFLIKQIGSRAPLELAQQMGVKIENAESLYESPSVGLGVTDAKLLDVVSAYSIFANKGIKTDPIYLLRIENKNGTVIYETTQEIKQVISEETAYVVLSMLLGNTKYNSIGQGGTGVRLRGSKYGFRMPIAGKTGTTQNQSDGWYIGLTPDLVTGVWTGCEDRAVHFQSIRLGGGNNTAIPAWGSFMKKVYADTSLHISQGDFAKPDTVYTNLNCKERNYIDSLGNTPSGTSSVLMEQQSTDNDRLDF